MQHFPLVLSETTLASVILHNPQESINLPKNLNFFHALLYP